MKNEIRNILVRLAKEGKTIIFAHLQKELRGQFGEVSEHELIQKLFLIGRECIANGEPCLCYLASRKINRMYDKFFKEFDFAKYQELNPNWPVELLQRKFFEKMKNEIFDYWFESKRIYSAAQVVI